MHGVRRASASFVSHIICARMSYVRVELSENSICPQRSDLCHFLPEFYILKYMKL